MIIILITALSLSTPFSEALLQKMSSVAAVFHKKCLQTLPQTSKHPEALAALTCGEKITDKKLQQNLSKTSLIHIFVVSGSHLILFDQLLSILKIPYLLRFLFLSFYSLCIGWQAPAVRALLGLGLRRIQQSTALNFPSDLLVLITGIVTLILFPSWWSSLSLLMSWCAALALCMVPTLRIKKPWAKGLAAQLSILIFMSAPLWGLGSLHPLSIIYNLFLGPVVAFLLLPLSILSLPCPPSVKGFDLVMTFFQELLPRLSDPIEVNKTSLPSLGFLWLWIFTWHVILHFLRLHLWQGKNS